LKKNNEKQSIRAVNRHEVFFLPLRSMVEWSYE
jgi:hypothetical protein